MQDWSDFDKASAHLSQDMITHVFTLSRRRQSNLGGLADFIDINPRASDTVIDRTSTHRYLVRLHGVRLIWANMFLYMITKNPSCHCEGGGPRATKSPTSLASCRRKCKFST
jgi:hypothetical protein